MLLAAGILTLPRGSTAQAETSADVQNQINVLLTRVRDLQVQATLLGVAYTKSLAAEATAVSGDAEADRRLDELTLIAKLNRARLGGRARALYMSGGPLAVYSTLTSSGSLADLADRTAVSGRVLRADGLRAMDGLVEAARASGRAKETAIAVVKRIQAERTLADLTDRLYGVLAEQKDVLTLLRGRLDKLIVHEAETALRAELARQVKAREATILTVQANADKAMRLSMGQAVGAVQSMLDRQQQAAAVLEISGSSLTLPVPVGTPATPCLPGPQAKGGSRLSPQADCVKQQVLARFKYVKEVGGCCGNGSGQGDHPTGHAVDFMLSYGKTSPLVKAEGDYLAAWVIVNAKPLRVKYIGWWQHIWSPDRGWRPECLPSYKSCGMDGAPTVTSMHEDHVHVSVY